MIQSLRFTDQKMVEKYQQMVEYLGFDIELLTDINADIKRRRENHDDDIWSKVFTPLYRGTESIIESLKLYQLHLGTAREMFETKIKDDNLLYSH